MHVVHTTQLICGTHFRDILKSRALYNLEKETIFPWVIKNIQNCIKIKMWGGKTILVWKYISGGFFHNCLQRYLASSSDTSARCVRLHRLHTPNYINQDAFTHYSTEFMQVTVHIVVFVPIFEKKNLAHEQSFIYSYFAGSDYVHIGISLMFVTYSKIMH